MNTNLEKLKEFFSSNKNQLEKNYPGIKLDRFLQESENLNENDLAAFLLKVLDGVPLAQISGKHFFYNDEFIIDENVLIPRSETEIIIEKAIGLLKNGQKFIDIGTGSGAIALSILTNFEGALTGFASDISSKALDIAFKNYQNLFPKINKLSSLDFFESDRLSEIRNTFDLIITNPPYIKKDSDRHLVHQQVLKYEPEIALFLDDAEYDQWFEELFQQCESSLSSGGYFLMEGHEDHLGHLKNILTKYKFRDICILQDYTGRDRFLTAIKKEK